MLLGVRRLCSVLGALNIPVGGGGGGGDIVYETSV